MAMLKGSVLVFTDQVILSANAVLSAIREVGNETNGEEDTLVMTQASVLGNNFFHYYLF